MHLREGPLETLTANWLAQLVAEQCTIEREVQGSSPRPGYHLVLKMIEENLLPL